MSICWGEDDRADVDPLLGGIADLELARELDDTVEEAVVDLAVRVDALDGDAHLAAVGEAAVHEAARRALDVDVGASDERRLAAELHDARDEALAARGRDALSRGDAAREDEELDAGVDERGARRAVAGDDLEEIRREACLVPDLLRFEGDERGHLARLEDGRVARDERHHDVAERELEGEVPRRDHADDAARHVVEDGLAVHHQVQRHLARRERAGRVLAEVGGDVGHDEHFVSEGLVLGLAALEREEVDDLVRPLDDRVLVAADLVAALLDREGAPRLLRRARPGHGGADLGFAHDGDLADELARGRRVALDHGRAVPVGPGAVRLRPLRCCLAHDVLRDGPATYSRRTRSGRTPV
jgi:hypothetical protein